MKRQKKSHFWKRKKKGNAILISFSIMNYSNGSSYSAKLGHVLKYPKILNHVSECFTLKFEKVENLLAAGKVLILFLMKDMQTET